MFNKYFYNLSVIIVGIVTAIFVLTTVGGLFHIPVNPLYVLIPFVCGLYYLKKQSPENIDFLKQVLILLLIIFVSCILAIFVWDGSWDGRWYHAATLVMLKNGWLPVYHNYQDFAPICHVYPQTAFWANSYLHFTEVIGANIYKITNLIESSKAINFIMTACVFMYSLNITKKFEINNFNSVLISLITVLNPVCICQWFTNYIDLHIYFAFTLLLLTIIKTEFQQTAYKADLFMFVCSSLMLAMTKLTGCMYLFLICSIYMIYLFILKRNNRKFIKTVLVIGGLIAVTGVNPFFTNFRDYGNPFYPVFGKNKIDIISNNLPFGFSGKSAPEMFLRSTFSESLNSAENIHNKHILSEFKIPFTVNIKSYFNIFNGPDLRIGGFGYFWSGILLLTLLFLPFLRFRNSNEKYLFWLITSIILLTAFSNPHCWWARLVPQIWLFPLIIVLFGFKQSDNNKISKVLKLFLLYFISAAFIINSSIILQQNSKFNIRISKLRKMLYNYIDLIKKPQDKIYLMTKFEDGDNTDETIIPHFEEYYGKNNIIYVPYDGNKIVSQEFIPLINVYMTTDHPNYFFKIGK